nr:MAG TPA: hypothetical protein [Caudoviricetes sp.]
MTPAARQRDRGRKENDCRPHYRAERELCQV